MGCQSRFWQRVALAPAHLIVALATEDGKCLSLVLLNEVEELGRLERLVVETTSARENGEGLKVAAQDGRSLLYINRRRVDEAVDVVGTGEEVCLELAPSPVEDLDLVSRERVGAAKLAGEEAHEFGEKHDASSKGGGGCLCRVDVGTIGGVVGSLLLLLYIDGCVLVLVLGEVASELVTNDLCGDPSARGLKGYGDAHKGGTGLRRARDDNGANRLGGEKVRRSG